MDLLPVDLDDDAQLHELYEVRRAANAVGRADAPTSTEQAFVAGLRHDDPGERQVLVRAVDDGVSVGLGAVWLFLLDNTDKSWAVVHVHPDHQRRGIGSALLDHVRAVARDDGRAMIGLDGFTPFGEERTHGYARFAQRHGFTYSNVEVVRHQPVPVPDATIDAWASEAAERAADYELLTFLDEFPDELAPSLCTLMGQLAVDAPTGEVEWEEETMTPERLRHYFELTRQGGRSWLETVAVRDGVVCAQTTIKIPHDRPQAFQDGTFVHREHRGHRLGLAVKAANQRALQGRAPHIELVRTQNAETNRWMIAINEQMGFVPYESSVEYRATP